MPYDDQGVYRYETERVASGDPLRKAAMELAYAVEAYLFDHNAPGYDRKEFMSWALSHFQATHNSSGTLANRQYRWDPKVAGQDTRLTHSNEKKNHERWTSGSAVDNGVRYPSAAFDNPDIDTSSDVPGEAELYEASEVNSPGQASEYPGEPTPVHTKTKKDGK